MTLSFPMGKEMKWRPQLQLTVTQLLCFATSKAPGHSVTVFLNSRDCKAVAGSLRKALKGLLLLQSRWEAITEILPVLSCHLKRLLWLKTMLIFLPFSPNLVFSLPALSRDLFILVSVLFLPVVFSILGKMLGNLYGNSY